MSQLMETCKSCGQPWRDHLGCEGLCAALIAMTADRDALVSDNAAYSKLHGELERERDTLVEALKACVQEFEHLCDDGTLVRKFVNQHPTMIRARAALAKVKGVE